MNHDDAALLWLDAQHEVTLSELTELSGLSVEELEWLVESGALTPIQTVSEPVAQQRNDWRFSSHCIVATRTASRLKRDFDLAPEALSLMLILIERIRALEQQIQQNNSPA